MNEDGKRTDPGRRYARAYAAHYSERDVRSALQMYTEILTAHPDSAEAKYAQRQIRNIVETLVPTETLLQADLDLARQHLRDDTAVERETPRAPEIDSRAQT